MKTVEFKAGDMRWHLCMNGAALFDIYEKFGRKGQVLDCIQGEDKQSFDNTCWLVWKLAEQGELVRRWQGHTPGRMPTLAQVRAVLSPHDVLRAKEAAAEAVKQGFAMELPPEEPEMVDLGLRRWREQQEDQRTEAEYLAPLVRLLGLSIREALLLTPGQTADLLEAAVRKE